MKTFTVVYPGSFDPVHNGHLMLAAHVAALPEVDEVWMLPSRRNPLKEHATLASDADRLHMLQAGVRTLSRTNVRVSDLEFHLPYPSYTINTLTELATRYPDRHFRLLIGADNWSDFGKWVRADEILNRFGVMIYPRPGSDVVPSNPNATLIPAAPLFPYSSTEVRTLVADEKSTAVILPDEVAAYIRQHSLYSDNTSNPVNPFDHTPT